MASEGLSISHFLLSGGALRRAQYVHARGQFRLALLLQTEYWSHWNRFWE